MTPNFCLIGISPKDDEEIPREAHQFNGSGVVLGSLLLVSKGNQSLRLKEETKQLGLHSAILHPQFPPEETEYLQSLALGEIRKHVENIHRTLDECASLKKIQCEGLLDETRWIKDILITYRSCETVASDVERVNDLVDVLISRLTELSKPQVLGAVKIED